MGNEIELETHPWEPFVPAGARVLIMGTFRRNPSAGRWISIIQTAQMTSGI